MNAPSRALRVGLHIAAGLATLTVLAEPACNESTPPSGNPADAAAGSPDASQGMDASEAPDAGVSLGNDAGTGTDAGTVLVLDSGSPAGDGGTVVRPLGTLTVTDGGVTCLGGAGTGATCMEVVVSCPGLPDLGAMIAVAEPSGTPKGTIVTHSGGGGGGFFNAGPAGAGTEAAYTAAGYRFVQLSWNSNWASTGDIKAAACRPATVFRWVFDNIHGGSRTQGFCGIGSSGGTAAITYSVSAYGLKDIWDYLELLAGPTPSHIDYGCDPSLYSGPPRNLCPLLTDAPWIYRPGVQAIADGWTGTSTCGQDAGPGPGDLTRWQSDQLLSSGDDFVYPQTGMSFWYCVTPDTTPGKTNPNESTGQATFYIEQVHPKDDPPDVNCYSGTCQGEWVLEDPSAFSLAVKEMEAGCVPNHQ